MAKCNVEILLDKATAQYMPGDKLCGRVKVVVDKEVRCNGLMLELYYQCEGKGNSSRESIEQKNLFEGVIKPGEHYYSFSITLAKDSPLTYEGDLFEVSWCLKASVDIPWSLDPVAVRIPNIVSASGKVGAINSLRQEQIQSSLAPAKVEDMDKSAFEILSSHPVIGCLGSILAFFAIVILNILSDKLPWVGTLMFFGMLGFLAWKFYSAFMQNFQVPVICSPLKSGPYQPGEIVDFKLSLTASNKIYISQVTAGLVFIESSQYRSGDSTRTQREKILLAQKQIVKGRSCDKGDVLDRNIQFKLPEHLISSFCGSSNAIEWAIEVDIDSDKYARIHKDFLFTVIEA